MHAGKAPLLLGSQPATMTLPMAVTGMSQAPSYERPCRLSNCEAIWSCRQQCLTQ